MQIRHTNGIWTADEDSLPHLSAPEQRRPPIKLFLSLAGRCNLRCFHCLGSSEELVRSSQNPGSASRELVDFIVDRVMPEVRAVRLGGIGLTEELTSETFDYFMERIAPAAPRLGSFELVTNLSLMTAERADRLASSLTDVQISIEGTGDNFTRLRGFPWSQLVRHFQMLREARQRNPESRMKITLLACAMSDTLDDLLRFDVFKSLGVDSIVLRELTPLVAHHEPHVLYREPERTRAFVREFRRRAEDAGIEAIITIADRYDPAPPPAGAAGPPAPGEPARAPRGPELRRCTLPFEVLSVVHSGRFGVCCYVTDLAGPVANLSTLSIMDVWNSPGFVALRQAVNSPRPPLACLACEVKVGHLGEAERALVRLPVELDLARTERDTLSRRLQAVEAERNVLRFEAEDLRRHLDAVEADRAARLDVIHAQGRRLGEVEAERNVLRFEVHDLRQHLDAIEADRAARLDVIRDQGRRLDEARAEVVDLREDAEERRRLIKVLTHQVHALDERLRTVEATRVYRWLRRLGRWQFTAEDPPRPPGARS